MTLAVVISENPISSWETYNISLEESQDGSVRGFYNLQKEERAEGGYYRASFNLRGGHTFLQDFMRNGLGRDVKIYSPNGIQVWEGYINELAYDQGAAVSRWSLDDMANRVWVRYRTTGGSTTVRSTALNDTDSQDRFGIKEFVLSGGELEDSDIADQVAQQYLNLHSWPSPSPVQVNLGKELSSEPNLSVKCEGYVSTLNWCVYNQTSSTDTQGTSAQVTDITGDSDVGQFIKATDIDANGTLVTKVYDNDRRGWDIIRDLARLGDANNARWIAGMMDNREFYFRQSEPAEA